MKKVVKASSINFGTKTLSINGDDKLGCYVEILERTDLQMEAMLSHHCKVLVVWLGLHVKSYTPDNKIMSDYMRKVRKKLTAQYKFSRIGFVWAREMERAKKQHYHFALIVDANKVNQSPRIVSICRRIAKAWELHLNVPDNCYYRIQRGNEAEYQEAYRRVSYLAKERGKGYKANSANDYSTSRIKAKAA